MAEIWGAVGAAAAVASAGAGVYSASQGGGGGKDGGGGAPPNSQSNMLSQLLSGEMSKYAPIQDELYRQVLEALQTGGITNQIPIINTSIEASRHATSNSLRQIDAALAQGGLTGTGTGERVRAEAILSGEQRTSQIPSELVMKFIMQALSGVKNPFDTVAQGMLGQGNQATQLQMAQMNNDAASNAAIMQLLGTGAQAVGQYMATPSSPSTGYNTYGYDS